MTHPYSDFVRGLAPDGTPPEAEQFDALWDTLAASLRREIRRRGLWDTSPAYLGVEGHTRWSPDAVEELVGPCYEHIFLRRLDGLLARLQVQDDIEGLVVLHVRNFLHGRQKLHDALGFRLYSVLRSAVEAAVEGGELEVVAGDRRLRNGTVLSFGEASVDLRIAGGQGDSPEPVPVPEAVVRRWSDLLLPELVTAQGKAQAAVADHLRRLLFDLQVAGVEVFRFGDLIDPLKRDVRSRWADLLDQQLGDKAYEDDAEGLPAMVRCIRPAAEGYADAQAFQRWTHCVGEAVEAYPGTVSTCRHLEVLWQFLRTWSAGEAEHEGPRLPSRRRLAELLRIPRERFAGLFDILGEMVESCRVSLETCEISIVSGSDPANSANPAVKDEGPRHGNERPRRKAS